MSYLIPNLGCALNMTPVSPSVEKYLPEIERTLDKFECAFTYKDGSTLPYGVQGLTDDNWSCIMTELNETLKTADRLAREKPVRQFVEEKVGFRVKPFIVNKIRINYPPLNKSRYRWHQDAATWPGLTERYPALKGAKILTLWLCATASDQGNGLGLVEKRMPVQSHGYVENQGYFEADVKDIELEGARSIFGPPLTAALFDDTTMHKSLEGSHEARLSFDLRYYYVPS